MKIHELPMGTHFIYEGQRYVKTGPLFASGPAGQRLIPRHARLTGCDTVTGETATSGKDARTAIEEFCTACRALLPPEQHDAFDALRQRLLADLTK